MIKKSNMDHLKSLWEKYKEYILYLIFGGLTTIVSWGVYYICVHLLRMDVVPANVISWILAVAFAYVTNRKWVFESKTTGAKAVGKEIVGFASGRLLTLAIETALLWLTVDIFHWHDMLMKVIISILVVILNYFFSKFFVFTGKNK